MAGTYPDAPGLRMAYDRDGSILIRIAADASVSQYAGSVLTNLNREVFSNVISEDYYCPTTRYAMIFPEPRDVVGVLAATTEEVFTVFQSSADTTNGFDGTWTARTPAHGGSSMSHTKATMRTGISAVSVTGAKAVRWSWDPYDANNPTIQALHLYGGPSAGSNPDRLRLWHPTSDLEVTGAYFDWGNVPRMTSQDLPFRIKNNSASLTANTVTVSAAALTDTTPTVAGQHLFERASNPGFTATVQVASLGPGGISEVITLRRVTPVNAGLGLWWARVFGLGCELGLMAGYYLDVPGPRIAYDRDGTVGLQTQSNWGVPPNTMAGATLTAMNSETTAAVISTTNGHQVGLVFPELRDIVGVWKATSGSNNDLATETSPNTTNGIDGIWTSRGVINMTVTNPSMRSSIQAVSWPGINGMRWGRGSNGNVSHNIHVCHLYGSTSTGLNLDRLRIWHPTIDTEIAGPHFDWSDVRRGTSADRDFRVKNNSTTMTATTITVSTGALTDTTPSVPAQHLFAKASDPTSFAATAAIPTLAPGAISEVLTVRRVTPGNAVMSLWWARILASAASWA